MRGPLFAALAFVNVVLPTYAAGLFDEPDRVLPVTLAGPLRDLARASDETEFEFSLTAEGIAVPVKLRQRGHFRKTQCRMPPLRLNFRRSMELGPFAGQDKLKLVNPCTPRQRSEQDLLTEFVLYRIANRVSDASFRVRLLSVDWQDSRRRLDWGRRHAFVIEDVEHLARRLGGRHIEPRQLSPGDLEPRYATRMALFQYLIGNTDFSMIRGPHGEPCCHNGKVIRTPDGLIVVPYDFDMSGAVDASYARPPPNLPIRSVRQRLYRGFCVERAVLERALADYRGIEHVVRATVTATPGLLPNRARALLRYLAGFFDRIKRPDAAAYFERQCRPTAAGGRRGSSTRRLDQSVTRASIRATLRG